MDNIPEKDLYYANIKDELTNLPGYSHGYFEETIDLIAHNKIIPNLVDCSDVHVGGYESDIA